MSFKFRAKKKDGFSLIELMIVVAIIGILAALAVPKFQTFQAKSRQAEGKNNLAHIYTLEQSYFADNDKFVDVTSTVVGTCPTPANPIGFTLNPCAKARYAYAVGGSSTVAFTGTAITGTGAANKVFPNCTTADSWSIIADKTLKDVNGALAACN